MRLKIHDMIKYDKMKTLLTCWYLADMSMPACLYITKHVQMRMMGKSSVLVINRCLTWCWRLMKTHQIAKVVGMYPLRNTNVCSKFNPRVQILQSRRKRWTNQQIYSSLKLIKVIRITWLVIIQHFLEIKGETKFT